MHKYDDPIWNVSRNIAVAGLYIMEDSTIVLALGVCLEFYVCLYGSPGFSSFLQTCRLFGYTKLTLVNVCACFNLSDPGITSSSTGMN